MRKFFDIIACCFNWRVATGLGIFAVAIGLWQPRLFLPTLSTTVFLICPLSMIVMALATRERSYTMQIGTMKLNWKIGLGIFLAGALLWIVTRQPVALAAFVPLLFGLACPIGMGLMMFMMMKGMGHTENATTPVPTPLAMPDPSSAGRTRPERVAALRAQMQDVQAQQQALTKELEALDAPVTTPRG